MFHEEPCKYKILFIAIVILLLFFSTFIYFFIPTNNGYSREIKNQNVTKNYPNQVTTSEQNQKNELPSPVILNNGYIGELELLNNTKESHDARLSRNNGDNDYDLRIQNINLNYSGLIGWQVRIGGVNYTYYIAGEIGKPSLFSITIRNVGKKYINTSHQVYLSINLTDYYGYSSWEQREYIGPLQPGNELPVLFNWTPEYSNCYNLTCYLSFSSDQNITDNLFKINNLYTKKWSDDFEDGILDGWSGDIGNDAWHLTDTIENDPNPKAHTSEFALYHSLEEDGKRDDYGEKNDFDLITPELDLRRFESGQPAYLNFHFYGASEPDKDKFTIEGYKSSEDQWFPIDIEFNGGDTLNESNLPAWYLWRTGFYLGIPINSYAGELVRFKIHWHSDSLPEDKVGFYFDDFFIYGIERPLNDIDVGIADIVISPINQPIVVGKEFQISANITNYGTQSLMNLRVDITVKDSTERLESTKPVGDNTINNLNPGNSEIITWCVVPSVGGIYFINISVDLEEDKNKQNNYINSHTVEVFKYYNSFEEIDNTWLADGNWVRKNVLNDPNPDNHSRTNAWYVGFDSDDEVNSSNILYSPIIDLDGAEYNPLYKRNQLAVTFNWLYQGGLEDKLYFELALDHSDNWILFPLPNNSSSIITGDNSDHWHLWEALNISEKSELFGHHLQFRWRYEPEPSLEVSERGFYIDDFSIWVIQEQYGRPRIKESKVIPNSIINDSRESALIICTLDETLPKVAGVSVNLEPIAGLKNQKMYDDGTHGDTRAEDNIYSTEVTVPTTVPKGYKILKITAVDEDGKFDNDYVRILVKENLPPEIERQYPINSNISINESEYVEFSIEASDPEDGNLIFSWYLNSELIEKGSRDYFLFNTSYQGAFSAGEYILRVVVEDNGIPRKNDYFEWKIEVLNVLPDFEVLDENIILSENNVTVNDYVDLHVEIYNRQPAPGNNVSIHFIQQTTDVSISDSVFKVYNISQFPGFATTTIFAIWQANISYKYLKVRIDPENVISELYEDNNEAFVPINVTAPLPEPQTHDNKTNLTSAQVPYQIYIATIAVIATIITLFIAIGTEFGNYKLYLMFAPLYYRVTGDKVLEHELRSKIYSYIRAHPGEHYRSIMMKLDIKNGTLVHHLARLEQEELITSERDGYFKRFYPVGMRIPKSDVGMYYPEGVPTYNIGEHQVSEIQLRIINTIRKYPGLTQKEIAKRINESRRVVNYHIKLLLQHDLIKVIKIGRETQCYAADMGSSSS